MSSGVILWQHSVNNCTVNDLRHHSSTAVPQQEGCWFKPSWILYLQSLHVFPSYCVGNPWVISTQYSWPMDRLKIWICCTLAAHTSQRERLNLEPKFLFVTNNLWSFKQNYLTCHVWITIKNTVSWRRGIWPNSWVRQRTTSFGKKEQKELQLRVNAVKDNHAQDQRQQFPTLVFLFSFSRNRE